MLTIALTHAHIHGFIAGILFVLILLLLIYLWQWFVESAVGKEEEWMKVIRSIDRPSTPDFPPDLSPIYHDESIQPKRHDS